MKLLLKDDYCPVVMLRLERSCTDIFSLIFVISTKYCRLLMPKTSFLILHAHFANTCSMFLYFRFEKMSLSAVGFCS